MSSYLITGASRGIGFEYVRQLSSNKENTVVAMVRNKDATEAKVKKELGVNNVFVVEGDLASYKSLKASVPVVEAATGGKLDYIIANGAYLSKWAEFIYFSTMGKTPERLDQEMTDNFRTNVTGNTHLFNLFMPFVLKGTAKKVITITSGHADLDMINKYGLVAAGPYAAAKAAMNVIVGKFQAEYAEQGVLFISLSPGVVDTAMAQPTTEAVEETPKLMHDMFSRFATYSPDFKGPATPEQSVKDQLKVIGEANVEDPKWRGAFVSHLGLGKLWI